MSSPSHHKSAIPLKTVVVFVILLMGVLLVYFTPLKDCLRQVRDFKEWLQGFGGFGRCIYFLVVLSAVGLGLPRLLFCPLGGMLYGLVEGLLWTQSATLIGYYGIFLFVRWGGRDWVLKHHPALGHIHEMFGRRPMITIFLVRQLPISGLLINLILGVSKVRHGHFLMGSLLGILPEAIPLTLVGSSAGKFDPAQTLKYITIGSILLVVVMVGAWILTRSSRVFDQLHGEMEAIEKEDQKTHC